MKMTNKQDIIPTIELQDINIKTEPGVYHVKGYGFAIVEQIEYPHESTLLRLAVDVEVLQRQEMQLENAKKDVEYYTEQTIKLRGQRNHESGLYGLPGTRDSSEGK